MDYNRKLINFLRILRQRNNCIIYGNIRIGKHELTLLKKSPEQIDDSSLFMISIIYSSTSTAQTIESWQKKTSCNIKLQALKPLILCLYSIL